LYWREDWYKNYWWTFIWPSNDGRTTWRGDELFQEKEGDDEENQARAFQVTIGKTMAFELITSYVAAGLSFRQACNVLQETHQRTGIYKLSGVRESDVEKYIRAIAVINLQKMSSLLQSKEWWAFSIAFDGTTKHGISFIGVRLRLHTAGENQNFHLLAIPLYERHTGSAMADLLSRVLSTLRPRDWTKKLIGISTDGAANMTGRVTGAVTLLTAKAFLENFVLGAELISWILSFKN
jgi:hypothetical protein